MLQDNLICLRNCRGLSQEAVAEKIGITRQAYAKWEKGESVPDIEKCAILAKFYDTTLDELFNNESRHEGIEIQVPPAPKGKHIFGTVIMNDKGQIVIPKKARDLFNFQSGDQLLILGDENANGLAIMKTEDFENQMKKVIDMAGKSADD